MKKWFLLQYRTSVFHAPVKLRVKAANLDTAISIGRETLARVFTLSVAVDQFELIEGREECSY